MGLKETSLYVSWILFRSILCCLVVTVLAQTGVQIKKYISNQRTIARSSEFHDELYLPAMSFCLGFHREKVLKLPWMTWFDGEDDDTFPTTKEDAEKLWEDVTLGPEDVEMYVLGPKKEVRSYFELNVLNAAKRINGSRGAEGCLVVEEHDTLTGKCYTVQWKCPVTMDNSGLELRFANLTSYSQTRLRLYFHDARDTLGLNENFWHSQVSTAEPFLNEFTDVLIKQHVTMRQTLGSQDDYFRCMQRSVNRWAETLNETSFCQFPSFGNILKHVKSRQDFPFCPSAARYVLALQQEIYPMLDATSYNTNCTQPNEQVTYVIKEQSQMGILPDGTTMVLIYYVDLEVRTEEEYVLLDLPAMLSAIGGFAGMLLGWSAKDLARLIPVAVEKFFDSFFFRKRDA